MKVHSVDATYDTQRWNTNAPHPLVSWEWGEARSRMGIEVTRIAEEAADGSVRPFQITWHPVPYTPFTIGYMPRTAVPSSDVIDALTSEAEKRRALFVKIEPYVFKDDFDENTGGDFLGRVVRSPHPLFPRWTQLLDITPSEESLLAGMKSKWRYNIRLAEKKGVTVREMTTDEGFELFADLYFKTTRRQKYAGHTKSYHKTVFEELRGTISHILVALYNNEPLSAYHLFLFNDRLYYPYGGSSVEHRNLMASNLLMWESIRFGKQNGAVVFDMWGSASPEGDARSSGWEGFSRFKEGFGTTYAECIGSYDLVLNPALYKVYNVADIVRKKLLF